MRRPELPASVLERRAIVYVRQSTLIQVEENLESQRRQYELASHARDLGFRDIVVIDDDLGISASGTSARPGFESMVAQICQGIVGGVFCLEASRLARNGRDWHHLLELCGLVGARVFDVDGAYDPSLPNDRLLLGLKGTMSEFELTVMRRRLLDAALAKARRGELRFGVPVGLVWERDGKIELDPDRRIQDAVRTVFRLFDRLGSARQVLLRMRADGLVFPRPADGKVARAQPSTEPDRARLMSLAADLETAWNAAPTAMSARQRLVRTLIQEIVVDVDDETRELILVLHWRGGRHSELRVRKPSTGEHTKRASAAADTVIREMATKWSDEHVAATLNRMGLKTGQGRATSTGPSRRSGSGDQAPATRPRAGTTKRSRSIRTSSPCLAKRSPPLRPSSCSRRRTAGWCATTSGSRTSFAGRWPGLESWRATCTSAGRRAAATRRGQGTPRSGSAPSSACASGRSRSFASSRSTTCATRTAASF